MKLILLMVFFSTPDNPEPHPGDDYGFGHRQVPTLEMCLKRRDVLLRQLKKASKNPKVKYAAFCTELELKGFEESMETFKKSIGELS